MSQTDWTLGAGASFGTDAVLTAPSLRMGPSVASWATRSMEATTATKVRLTYNCRASSGAEAANIRTSISILGLTLYFIVTIEANKLYAGFGTSETTVTSLSKNITATSVQAIEVQLVRTASAVYGALYVGGVYVGTVTYATSAATGFGTLKCSNPQAGYSTVMAWDDFVCYVA